MASLRSRLDQNYVENLLLWSESMFCEKVESFSDDPNIDFISVNKVNLIRLAFFGLIKRNSLTFRLFVA